MNGYKKNTVTRVFLLLFITAMLALIAAKLHYGDGAFEAISRKIIRDAKTDAPASQLESRNGSALTIDAKEVPVSFVKSEDVRRILSDGSNIGVMRDGYGNTTTTRSFDGHKLIRMVMVRENAKGAQRVFVYGKNGSIKNIPNKFFDRVLTASADEIASTAKIYDSTNENSRRKQRIALIQSRQRQEAQEKYETELQRKSEQAERRGDEASSRNPRDPEPSKYDNEVNN